MLSGHDSLPAVPALKAEAGVLPEQVGEAD